MTKFLTEKCRNELRLQHKKERDKRICDRIKAVLLYDEGWTCEQIGHALLLTDSAIRKHISDYQNSKKINTHSGGSSEKLSDQQSKVLEEHLEEHTYLYVKDIVAHVKATWDLSYTVPGMRHWLRRHAFNYKKPALVPGKANKEAQKKWIAEYEELKQGLADTETICFMDGVHPTHNTQITYGWIKKGVRKEIPTNTGRSRINISGAIDMISHKVLVQEDQTLNAESTLNFLKRIEGAYPRKNRIHLFCDNARYYRNRLVMKYLESSKIEMHFLPPYSPNLNPIERLWKWMKERVMYNTYYQEFDDFKSAVFGFFYLLANLDTKSVLGECFRSRIRDKFRPIGSPLPNF